MKSIINNLKDRKTLLTCLAIIVLAIVALALIFSGGERKGAGEGEELVLASKRVKLTKEERAEGTVAAKATVKTPVKAQPKKAVKLAPPKKKTAPKKKVAKKAAPKKKAVKEAPPKKVVKLAATLPWAINLASFSKASAAKDLAAKLKSYKYNAYTTEFEKDGQVWHRVRIGFYKSRREAMKVASALSEKKLVRSKPWVVKPQTDEVIKYTR